MKSNPQAHIENNHPKHSQKHAYSLEGEFLGHKDNLELVQDYMFNKFIRPDSNEVIYDRDTCTYTVSNPSHLPRVYEVVLTQNSVILGYRRIT